jgi:hypothetical protein
MFRSNRTPRLLGVLTVALAILVAGVATATAGHSRGTEQYRAVLGPVAHDAFADAGSNANGVARLARRGNRVNVVLTAGGLSPRLPHAIHIHGKEEAGEIATCPGAGRRDDIVDDGLIETAEGLDDYGPVLVSFTTRGDTSADSILALDRFPVANSHGRVTYRRSLRVPSALAARLDELHVVVHGDDLNNDRAYGGRTTALGAPLEGELPVACGRIVRKRG